MKTFAEKIEANKAFWQAQDAAAYRRGMRYSSGHACGGNAYHRTRETAERAVKRNARITRSGNPPAWDITELKNPDTVSPA